MEDESFEIEEEFDLSLLGLEPNLSDINVPFDKNAVISVSKDAEAHTNTLSQSNNPVVRTALDLLRSVAGSYASADWTPVHHAALSKSPPNPLSNGSSTSSAELDHSKRSVSHAKPERQEDEMPPVIRDFASSPTRSSATKLPEIPAVNGGHDMEKTESYVSTALSAGQPNDNTKTVNTHTRPQVTWVRTRLAGRRRYRTGIRVHRAPTANPEADITHVVDETASLLSVPARPQPNTQFQRDFADTFGRAILDKLQHQAKLDSTSGNAFPPVVKELFPALADMNSVLRIANVIRRRFELPLLNNKSDKIALRRAVAKMRETLYTEMMAALALPMAPESIETEDEDEKEQKTPVTLTPTALQILAVKIPQVFPAERNLINAFLADEFRNAYGETKGQVIWQGGVGRVRGKGDGGFRGTVDTDGLCHIYVDHSNILHGLLHHLYAFPSDALPPRHLRTLSLPALSLLLRRGRPTPPGSLHLVASSPLHQNLDTLVRLGWEVSVLKRVELYEDEVEDPTSMNVSPRPQARISGHNDVGLRRYREQGVDEILHLKMLQVLNQKGNKAEKGSTLVLATGDARGGQFNRDGFPGAVREALKRGWNVELWSFTSGLSRAWKETARRERWHELGKFTIWALDDWAEQLVEVGEDEDDV